MTQAPWFEEGVARKIKRRIAEAKSSGELLPLIKQSAIASAVIAECQTKFTDMHEKWRSEQERRLDQLVVLLEGVLAELRKFNGEPGPRAHAGSRTRA